MTPPPATSAMPLPTFRELHQRAGGGHEHAPHVLRDAFDFVALCNAFMEPKACLIPDPDGPPRLQIHEKELPAKQHAALVHACNYVGAYFATALQRDFAAGVAAGE